MITAMPRIAIATHDFEGILRSCREVLGMPVVDISQSSAESLGAKLAMCVPPGGSNIELMCPAVPEAPLAQSLEKFIERRGQGLFALMLEAPEPDLEAERLSANGLAVLPRMAGAGGRDLHPRSTCGVLIRVYPDGSFQASAEQRVPDPARHLDLSGIARVIIAVADLARAMEIYGNGLGLAMEDARPDPARGVATARCRPPAGGVIELAAVTDPDRPFAAAVAAQLEQRGEGMFALVLEAPDPAAVLGELAARGLVSEPMDGLPGAGLLDLFGARVIVAPREAAA